MGYSMHIYYAQTKERGGDLFIACYHDKVQALTNARYHSKDYRSIDENNPKKFKSLPLKGKDFIFDKQPDHTIIEAELFKLLNEIVLEVGTANFNEVLYYGDVNLCLEKTKPDTLSCFFDGSMKALFSGKKVQLFLESQDKGTLTCVYLKVTANYTQLKGITLQTKYSEKVPLVKVLDDTQTLNADLENEIDFSMPPPDNTRVASTSLHVPNDRKITDSMRELGFFSDAKVPGSDDSATDMLQAPKTPPVQG